VTHCCLLLKCIYDSKFTASEVRNVYDQTSCFTISGLQVVCNLTFFCYLFIFDSHVHIAATKGYKLQAVSVVCVVGSGGSRGEDGDVSPTGTYSASKLAILRSKIEEEKNLGRGHSPSPGGTAPHQTSKSLVWLSHLLMSFMFTKWQWPISRNYWLLHLHFTFPISNTTDEGTEGTCSITVFSNTGFTITVF